MSIDEANLADEAAFWSEPSVGVVMDVVTTSSNGPIEVGAFEMLSFLTAAEHAKLVDDAPPVGWLAKPVWPADAYGVLAAAHKVGKTWDALDLAVSVASGTPWLELFPCERQGRVLVFLGEGGPRKMLRRLRAVCAAKGVRYENLPIDLCFRAPHLKSSEHLASIAGKIGQLRFGEHEQTALVIIDPLYLAARGAKGAALYEMGEHLENVQNVVQRAGAALFVSHHWNQTGNGSGAERMSGAGPAEWGRVLVSAEKKHSRTDKATKASATTVRLSFIGDEIPETAVSIIRHVWADDPDDLESPLNYRVEVVEQRAEGEAWRPTALMEKVSRWLELQPGHASKRDIEGAVPGEDKYVRQAADELVVAGYVERVDGPKRSQLHRSLYPYRDGDPIPFVSAA